MRFCLILALVLAPSLAMADAGCVTLEDGTLINRCDSCRQATVHEMRPPGQQSQGLFTGTTRTVRLEGNARSPLAGSGSWALGDEKSCP
jgi:hypothetical protein